MVGWRRILAALAAALVAFALVTGFSVAVASADPGFRHHSLWGHHRGGKSIHGNDRGHPGRGGDSRPARYRDGHGRGKTSTSSPHGQTSARQPTTRLVAGSTSDSAGGGRISSAKASKKHSGRARRHPQRVSGVLTGQLATTQASAKAPTVPRATFGNGRTPRPKPAPVPLAPGGSSAVNVLPAQPAMPAPAIPAPIFVPAQQDPPAPQRKRSALEQLHAPRPGQSMWSLFGIAGLLLIPVAGAVFGYRQARTAREVETLTSS